MCLEVGLSMRKVLVWFGFIGLRLILFDLVWVMMLVMLGMVSSVVCSCVFMVRDLLRLIDGSVFMLMIMLFLFIVGMKVLLSLV